MSRQGGLKLQARIRYLVAILLGTACVGCVVDFPASALNSDGQAAEVTRRDSASQERQEADAPRDVGSSGDVADGSMGACPDACANGCAGGICEPDCAQGCTCPSGWPCAIDCASAACGPVSCAEATRCEVTCLRRNCPEISCGRARCTIVCSGNACRASSIDCSQSAGCCVVCDGDNACRGEFLLSCPPSCSTSDACRVTSGTLCEDSRC